MNREDVRGKKALFTCNGGEHAPNVFNYTVPLFSAVLDESLPGGHKESTEEELANVVLPAISIDWFQVTGKTWVAPYTGRTKVEDTGSIDLGKAEFKKWVGTGREACGCIAS